MAHKSISNPREPRHTRDSTTSENAQAETNAKYESALTPLLWLLIPLVLVLIYGFLN